MSVLPGPGDASSERAWTREEPSPDAVRFRGRGLHTGANCELVLRRHRGPLRWVINGEPCTLAACEVVETTLGVVLRTPGGQRLHVVECVGGPGDP